MSESRPDMERVPPFRLVCRNHAAGRDCDVCGPLPRTGCRDDRTHQRIIESFREAVTK